MSEPELVHVLLERWQAGDQAAAEEIFRRYSQRLCELAEGHISQRLRRRVDAEDVVQSVFRTFFRRAGDGQYSIDDSVSLWRLLVRITVNKVRLKGQFHTAERRKLGAEFYVDASKLPPEMVAHDPTPGEAAALAEEVEAVITGLTEDHATMLGMRLQGFSTSEIGAHLGCSRWRVRRGLDRIGERLLERLGDYFDEN